MRDGERAEGFASVHLGAEAGGLTVHASRTVTLDVLPGRLAVCRLAPDAPVAPWMGEGPLASVTRTEAELSVVCADAAVPAGVTAEVGWRALRVRGPLAFDLTGVLAALAAPLAAAGIPIFALSTYDTDVVLVKADRLADAVATLCAAGHGVGDEG